MNADRSSTSRHRLDGKVALVTGGARGIGRAYVERLRSLGADVAVIDARLEVDSNESSTVEGQGVLLELEVDLTDFDATHTAAQEVAHKLGQVDILICNAGGGSGHMWENTPSTMETAALRLAFETNMVTLATACRVIVPSMVERGTGKVVSVASTAALIARADGGYAHYASAKASVIAYTRSLAREVAPRGVTANVVVPGAIGTERLLPKMRALGMEKVVAEIPLGRLGTPDDCADAIEFLAGPLSDYVTGSVIRVDGGLAT